MLTLELIKKWFSNDYIEPEHRVAFFTKLRRFEKVRPVKLRKTCLDIIYIVYSESKFSNNEFAQIEGSILIGIATKDIALRKQFLDHFMKHNKHAQTMDAAVRYMFEPSTWSSIGRTYWIQQALAIILHMCKKSSPIKLARNCTHMASISEGSTIVPDVIGDKIDKLVSENELLTSGDYVETMISLLTHV